MAETRQPPVHQCLEAHGSEQAFALIIATSPPCGCGERRQRRRRDIAGRRAGNIHLLNLYFSSFLPSTHPLLYLMRSDRLHHCSASFMEMKVAAAPIGARRIFKNSVVRSWLQTYPFIFGNSCPLHSLHSNPHPTFLLQHMLHLLHHRCSGLKIRHLLLFFIAAILICNISLLVSNQNIYDILLVQSPQKTFGR